MVLPALLLLVLVWLVVLPPPVAPLPCPRPCSCPQPAELHCTFRSLLSVPAGVHRQVERINLGFNSINQIPESSLAGLLRLELLMLHGNDIHSIPSRAFRDLGSLQMLKMSYNKLKEINRDSLHGLWALARLHLDHNRLEVIHPDAFQGLTSLRLLQLEGNRLQQLHPATFTTFSVMGHFHVSTLRHLYLSDNGLTSLPRGMLGGMPQLESLYLQGNPWTCDCRMTWFLDWDKNSPGVLKCKKDRSYAGGQLCPACSAPRHLQGKEVLGLDGLACSRPVIVSAQRPAAAAEDTESEVMTPEEFREPFGNVSLGLSDEHGNKVDLECAVGEPRETARVSWRQDNPLQLSANLSLSVDLDCPIDRDNYERLWRLIAYYSDVPAHLQRELMLTKEPAASYRYRQDAERDALYYTGVRAAVAARPAWLMQSNVDLRLNRPQSTGKSVKLVLSTRLTQTVEAEVVRREARPWVLVEATNRTRWALSAVAGSPCQMDCNVRSSGEAEVRWMLPDGSQLTAPSSSPDNRVSVSGSGRLLIKTVGHSDAGTFYCIARVGGVGGDLSVLPFHLAVEESSSPPPGATPEGGALPVDGMAGDPVALPCVATAAPDAEISWILPDGSVVSSRANSSRALVFTNGTLAVPQAQPADSGYYKCVAVNQHGADSLATKVTVIRRAGVRPPLRKYPMRPQSASGVNTKVKVPTEGAEDEASGNEGGDGAREEEEEEAPPSRVDLLTRRRGGQSLAGGRRGGGGRHPFRNTWRRPPVQRKPAAGSGRTADARNEAGETRRRINVSNNKIDPEKWADILAKIRDRTSQSSATPSQTPRPAGGPRQRRPQTAHNKHTAVSQDNVEGSSEGPPLAEEELYTPQKHGNDHDRAPTNATASGPRITRPTSAPRGHGDALTHSQAPRGPQGRQTGDTDSSSSAPDDSSSQENQRSTTDQETLTVTVSATSASSASSEGSDDVTDRSDDTVRTDLQTERDERDRSLTETTTAGEATQTPAVKFTTTKLDVSQAPTPLGTTAAAYPTAKPTTGAAVRKVTPGGGGARGAHARLRNPSSRRRNGAKRRNRKKGKQNQKSAVPTATPTLALLTTTTPSATSGLNIATSGTPGITAVAKFNTTVPLTASQASHKESTVSGYDARGGPDPRPSSSALPETKDTLLPRARPPLSTTSAPTSFPSASPRGAGEPERTSQQGGPATGAGVSQSASPQRSSEDVTTAAGLERLTSVRLPAVKPSGDSQRGGVTGDLSPVPSPDGSSGSTRAAQRQVQPDAEPGLPTHGDESSPAGKVPFDETDDASSSSAPATQQREIAGGGPPETTLHSGGAYEPGRVTMQTSLTSESSYQGSGPTQTGLREAVSESSPAPRGGDAPGATSDTVAVKTTRPVTSTPAKTSAVTPSRARPHTPVHIPETSPPVGRTRPGASPSRPLEGPNHIPDSHSERVLTSGQITPLSPDSRDPLLDRRPDPNRPPTDSHPTSRISSDPRAGSARGVEPSTTELKTPTTQTHIQVHRESTISTSTPAPTRTSTRTSSRTSSSGAVGASTTGGRQGTGSAPTLTRGGASEGPRRPGGGAGVPVPRGKPRITTPNLQTVTVNAETDAQLPCEAIGAPKPFLSWTKVSTGASVAQNTRVQRFEVHPNGTFIIRNAQPLDRGQYLCTVQNQYGVDKMAVTLAVSARHPRVLEPRYRDAVVQLGDSVELECKVQGHPVPRVTWVLPDRVHLAAGAPPTGGGGGGGGARQRVSLLSNGTLRITAATHADRGIYKCIGSSAAGADTVSVRLQVTALPPAIRQARYENATLPEGGAAYLHCTAKGAPPPVIHWTTPDGLQLATSQFVNGRNLFVFPNGTLHLRALGQADGGRYECVAGNALGASRRTIILRVQKTPSSAKARISSSSPQRTDVVFGGKLHLDCLATGDPEPRVIWRTPSKKLVDAQYSFDPRIKVFANGTLTIQSMTDKDGGDYLCVARNKMGDDYVLLRVSVLAKPAKIEQKQPLASQEVIYGGELKVDCVASGLPNPEISWALPDGTMVNPLKQTDRAAAGGGGRSRRFVVFDNGTLYFNEVGMREGGDYTCYAENQVGKDEMRVHVKVVADPPVIAREHARDVVRVLHGETATLRCGTKGEPAPVVSWTSPANRAIPPASDKYQILTDGTLVVQKAQSFDAGNYTCVVRNSAGQDRKVTQVDVLVTPPTINGLKGLANVVRATAVRDQRKLLDCTALGTPLPRVMWVLPENVVLPAPYYGSRMTVHRNGTLEIRAARRSDSAQLVCVARSEGGEARLTVHLEVGEVADMPRLRGAQAESVPLTVGSAMVLNCSFQGAVTWILPSGAPLPTGVQFSRFFHRPDGSLVIGNPSISEAGTYRCLGRDAAGLVERSVTVTPGRPPEIANRYNSPISIMNGETLLLHCLASGEPLKLTWTLPSGVVLGPPQRAGRYAVLPNGTLAIQQASVYDRGSYSCRAANEYGSSLLAASVIVIAYPPRITSGPPSATYARRGVAVQLNCMATGIPRVEVAWETPDRMRLAAGAQPRLFGNKYLHPQGALVIQNPSQRDAGFYRCTARNVVGVDSKATYLHVF